MERNKPEAAAKAERLSFFAGKKQVLKNISFEVNKGEFMAVLGPNGAGKTSLIKAFLGFNRPASGRVFVEGTEVSPKTAGEIRRRTAYLPQSFDVDRNFPILVKDVVSMGCGYVNDAVVKELNIRALLERPFGLISGGERQKAMLAMVLSRNPSVLFFDEPNLNLDPFSYRNFLKVVSSVYAKHGLTVIFVTHLVTNMPEACKRVLVLKEGEVIRDGEKEKVMSGKNFMEAVYG